MASTQMTWGEIKQFMEVRGIPDEANVNIEVSVKGIKPTLTANGWVNGMETVSPYTVTLRSNNT